MTTNATNYGDGLDVQLQALLERVPAAHDGHQLVQRAFEVAERLHHGQRRKSGELYIEHPLAVARLLADLNLDASTIAAGLLHDVLEDTDITYKEMQELFPAPVPDIVDGVTKIGRIHFDTSREHQVENLRKIMLAMARDIRVLIVKLCDRLHNMRTLRYLGPEKRANISRETLDIYAPLANRLGMVLLKSELEDLSMYWLFSDDYRRISRKIQKKKDERDQMIAESIDGLRTYLSELGHDDVTISGRSKHFYSIFRKMKNSGLTFDEIYDLNAIRILCNSKAQCYEILGQIHERWHPLPNRIKDYIGMPKPNLYQSLHTTVIGYKGMVTEIQIRTHEMHEIAEYGIAAHWRYKEGLDPNQNEEKRFQWLRQLTEWVTETGDPNSVFDSLKKDVFADIVLCFTPQGDVIELPAGASPIDFAFAIHTHIGTHCTGAKVNRRIVSLRTELHHGDVVEILTSNSGRPSRDWLDVVKTGRARQKIKHWLKSEEMERWVSDGRAALNRLLKERNIDVPKAELDKYLDQLREPFRLQSVDDVLAEIGFGSISPQAALTRMNPAWSKKRRTTKKTTPQKPRQEKLIIVDGLEELDVRIAACCNPIPGDEIVGFVTRGRGVSVHRSDCKNIQRIYENPKERARFVRAHWNIEGPVSRTVYLRVDCRDRTGLLLDLTQVMSSAEIFILGCQTRSDKKRDLACVRFELEISNLQQLDAAIEELKKVPAVHKVERVKRFTT